MSVIVDNLDVFVGDKYGYVRYLRNDAGADGEPVYVELTGAATGNIDRLEVTNAAYKQFVDAGAGMGGNADEQVFPTPVFRDDAVLG